MSQAFILKCQHLQLIFLQEICKNINCLVNSGNKKTRYVTSIQRLIDDLPKGLLTRMANITTWDPMYEQ